MRFHGRSLFFLRHLFIHATRSYKSSNPSSVTPTATAIVDHLTKLKKWTFCDWHTSITEHGLEGRESISDELDVRSACKNSSEMYAPMTLDQANTAPWKNAWTNLQNDVWQTFTPSLPRLTRVEVELVVTNPDVLTNHGGPSDGEVVMSLHNGEGEVLAWISKTVPVAECSHVLFIFPDGGLRVSPGRVYSIRVRNAGIFGWKYVGGGYSKGAAFFNGKPLFPDTHSTFLFRTFGTH